MRRLCLRTVILYALFELIFMKIEVLENEIKIKDNASSQFFMLKFLLILNSISGTLYAVKFFKEGKLFPDFILATLGVLSILLLLYFIYFKSFKEQYQRHEILSVDEKIIFGKSFIRLKLTNGKRRDILGIKLKNEIPQEVERIESFLKYS